MKIDKFFNEYILNPCSRNLSIKEKRQALVASVVLFILTAGLVHLVCAIAHSLKGRITRQSEAPAIAPDPARVTEASARTLPPQRQESHCEIQEAPPVPVQPEQPSDYEQMREMLAAAQANGETRFSLLGQLELARAQGTLTQAQVDQIVTDLLPEEEEPAPPPGANLNEIRENLFACGLNRQEMITELQRALLQQTITGEEYTELVREIFALPEYLAQEEWQPDPDNWSLNARAAVVPQRESQPAPVAQPNPDNWSLNARAAVVPQRESQPAPVAQPVPEPAREPDPVAVVAASESEPELAKEEVLDLSHCSGQDEILAQMRTWKADGKKRMEVYEALRKVTSIPAGRQIALMRAVFQPQ